MWPDGALIGVGSSDVCWRVFRPAWWHVFRWLVWWFERRPRGIVAFTLSDGRKMSVRVVLSDHAVMGPPSIDGDVNCAPRERFIAYRVDDRRGRTEAR